MRHPQVHPSDVHRFPELRYQFGKNLDTLKHYILSALKQFSGESLWLNLLCDSSLCDNFLLDAGFATVQYPSNVFVLSSTIGLSIPSLHAKEQNITSAVSRLANMISNEWDTRWLPPTFLIPVHMTNHWGMLFIIADENSPKEGKVTWGDSLNQKPPGGLLQTVTRAMNIVTKETQYEPFYTKWTGDKTKNFMVDTLNYMKQNDGYSCGYYCVCAAWHFRDNSVTASLPFEGYKIGKVTSEIRQAAIRTAVSAILQCAAAKRGKQQQQKHVSHMEVSQLLRRIISRKATIQTQMQYSLCLSWPTVARSNISNIAEWGRTLESEGFILGGATETPVKRGYKYDLRVRRYCICYGRKQKCRASILMLRHKGKRTWDIQLKGKHNHSLLPCSKKSKRFTTTKKNLERLQEKGHL